jgi:regulator of protease activity HflC (stomatin/prohibitin superfamily)
VSTLTSAEHVKKAEELMLLARGYRKGAIDPDAGGSDLRADWTRRADQLMAEAQVHATLALAKREADARSGSIKEAGVQALRDAADLATDRDHGLDGGLIRDREKRGFMQRHNVLSAARWMRYQADELENS